MPDTDDPQEIWQPNRGRVFKVVVWVLLILIVLVVLGSLLVGLLS